MRYMYHFVAVMLYTGSSRLSMRRTGDNLERIPGHTMKKEKIDSQCLNVPVYTRTISSEENANTLNLKCDPTRQLGHLESMALLKSTLVVIRPNQLIACYDDVLFMTRAVENAVKSLADKRAAHEDDTAGVLAESLLRVAIHVRFRRRKYPHSTSVQTQHEAVLVAGSERIMGVPREKVDRGYSAHDLIEEFVDMGVGVIRMLPMQSNATHPFGILSLFPIVGMKYTEDDGELHVMHSAGRQEKDRYKRNRPNAFIVDDDPIPDVTSFHARRDWRQGCAERSHSCRCCPDVWTQAYIQFRPCHVKISCTIVRLPRIHKVDLQSLSTV